MALTEQELAPWHRRIANFEHVIGRPSYITIQDGWPFGYWFMGNDHSRIPWRLSRRVVIADPPCTGEDAEYYGDQTAGGIQDPHRDHGTGRAFLWLDQMRLSVRTGTGSQMHIAIDCSTNRRFRSAIVYRKL